MIEGYERGERGGNDKRMFWKMEATGPVSAVTKVISYLSRAQSCLRLRSRELLS